MKYKTSIALGLWQTRHIMKLHSFSTITLTLFSFVAAGTAAEFGPSFYGDAPDDHHPWAVHDGNRPQPTIVTPGTFNSQDQPGTLVHGEILLTPRLAA